MKGSFCGMACILANALLHQEANAQVCDDAKLKAALETKVNTLREDLTTQIEAKKQEVAAKAEGWKKESDSLDKDTAALNFVFDVTHHDEKIILDLPDITMKDQKWIIELPEVRLNEQRWIWDRPDVVMVPKKTGQYPEFVCRPVRNDLGIELPECYTKWSDIITNVPEIRMTRTETILGVPEFAMKPQEMIVRVPEFSLRRQEIILRIPDFTLKDVKVTSDKIKADAGVAAQQNKREVEQLSAEFKARIEQATASHVSSGYQCRAQSLREQQDKVLAQIDSNIATIEGSLKIASDTGATELGNQMRQALVSLREARQKAVTSFADAFQKIEDAQKQTLTADGLRLPGKPGAAAATIQRVKFKYLRSYLMN